MRMTRDEFNHISAGLRGRLTALAGRFGESALLPLSAEDVVQEALAALWQLSEKNYPIRDYEAMAAYYVFNAPDEDEREFAMLLRISLSGNILSEETADEFDRLVCMHSDRPAGKKRRVAGIWIAACLACAASLALFLILRNPDAKPLYIVDGKEMEKGSTLSIAPDKIASIKVFKPGSREAAVYGEKGDNGVVVVSIVTDKDNASDSGALEPLYIIDGEISDKKAVDKLDVNKIESINVVKDQYAAKRYTEETKAGVVYIKTKK